MTQPGDFGTTAKTVSSNIYLACIGHASPSEASAWEQGFQKGAWENVSSHLNERTPR